MTPSLDQIYEFAHPMEFSHHSCGSGLDLPPVLNGVRCHYCDKPVGKSYLVSRGRAVCGEKKCRFKLAKEERCKD